MKELINFIKLDLITIKPYLSDKRLLIYLGLALALPYMNEDPLSAISLILIFTMMITTYPFAISDQNHLELLYTSLGVKRKHVVLGRYMTLFILYGGAIIIGIALYILLSLVMQTPISIKAASLIIGSLIVLMSLSQAIQFPLFFKNGYLQSKALTYMPFALISLFFLLGNQLYINYFKEVFDQVFYFMSNHIGLVLMIVIIIWSALMYLSYRYSLKAYVQKDL